MKPSAVSFALLFTLLFNAAEADTVHVGNVLAVSGDRLDLDQGGSFLYIGFVADADAAASITKIKVGSEVRAVFGVTRSPDGREINKLVSIRVCEAKDDQCAADRARESIERAERDQRQEAAADKHRQCRQAMNDSLAKDSRYVADFGGSAREEDLASFNALSGARKACAQNVLREHQQAVYESCELHRCGENIGGGCAHIVGRSMTGAAIRRAVAECGT